LSPLRTATDRITPDRLRLLFGRHPELPAVPVEDPHFFGGGALEDAGIRALLPATMTPASVLVPLVDRSAGMTVLLTERASHLKRHPGQIALPGGRREAHDADVVATALRETREEIGLDPARVEVVGRLREHIVLTGYRITPVVGIVTPVFDLALDHSEVASTFEVPLDFLADDGNRQWTTRNFGGRDFRMAEYHYGERRIWGATAAMLVTLVRELDGRRA
jgi:8-oxo-dGTP pyrophosphatase MutT (NUDIX family)